MENKSINETSGVDLFAWQTDQGATGTANVFDYNDNDQPMYGQLAVPFQIQQVSIRPHVEAALNESANFYSTYSFEVIDVGVQLSKDMMVGGKNFPISVTYILNLVAELSHMFFIISI